MVEDYVVEKIVVIAGTTGIGLKKLYSCLRGKRLKVDDEVCIYHFEDLLEEEYGETGECRDIEQLIAMMLTSRPAATRVFKRAVERARERLKARNCKKAILFAHLTYLSRRMIIANPVINDILSLGREASIIYMVDDFFDALRRMALKASERIIGSGSCSGLPVTPYNIDPVLYLTWRAADTNILSIVDSIKPGTEIFTYGVKHPASDFAKLLKRVLKTRSEYLMDSRPSSAYVSHPITQVRALYVALGNVPISDISIVKAIEAFKEALRTRDPELILFEPTTIDELHNDRYGKILDYISKLDLSDVLDLGSRKIRPDQLDKPVTHSLFVDSYNRWPFSYENLREYCSGERIYPYSGRGRTGLLDAEMAVLYGDDLYHNIQVDVVVHNTLLEEPALEGVARGILASQLHDLIKAQIEERDYAYVSQSDHIIAVTTGIVVDSETTRTTGLSEGIYIPWSTGMDAEIQRARALAKPITYYILPVCFNPLASGDIRDLEKLTSVLKEGFSHCQVKVKSCERDEALEAVRKCAVRIQRGGLFATIGGGVRVCVNPTIVSGDESYDELVEAYSRSLC